MLQDPDTTMGQETPMSIFLSHFNKDQRSTVSTWLFHASKLQSSDVKQISAYKFILHGLLKTISNSQQANDNELEYDTFHKAYCEVANEVNPQQEYKFLASFSSLAKDKEDFLRVFTLREWLVKSMILAPTHDQYAYKNGLHAAYSVSIFSYANIQLYPHNNYNGRNQVAYGQVASNQVAFDPYSYETLAAFLDSIQVLISSGQIDVPASKK